MTAEPATHARHKKLLVILLGCALAIHLISDIGVYAFRVQSISTTPDPLDYRLAALSILDYGKFSFAPEFNAPQMLRTPVYPALVAAGYLVDGRTGLAIIIVQSLMLVAMGWMLYWLLMKFRVPSATALVLVAVYLFEPLQWLYTLHTMTETTASFCVLALITAALVGKGIHTWAHAALFGIGLGLTILVKPSALMWAPFLLALMWVGAHGTWRARLIRTSIAVGFCVLALLPWMIRNYNLTGYPAVSSSSAYAFVFMYSGVPDMVTPGYETNLLPKQYWDVVKMASYNGHSNQVWYAYTTDAYPMLLSAGRAIGAHLNYPGFIMRQITYAPHVWFGFWEVKNHESLGHEYNLIADFILGANATRDAWVVRLDFVIWSLALALVLSGTWVLLRDRALRLLYLPLLAMLLVTVFLNYSASWVRMLLPVYPAIFVGIGASIPLVRSTYVRILGRRT